MNRDWTIILHHDSEIQLDFPSAIASGWWFSHVLTILKNMKVSWEGLSKYIMEK
jgi:hypothetical protein